MKVITASNGTNRNNQNNNDKMSKNNNYVITFATA